MKKTIIAAVVAAVAALGVAAAALAATRPGAAAARHTRPPVVFNGLDGWSGGAVRPAVVYLGASNVFVRTPRWSEWTSAAASARGTLWVNTCAPTCAAGHYRTYPATVRLWRTATRRGVAYFSRLAVSYVHGQQRRYLYTWGVLPGASIPGWNGVLLHPAAA